ncbi:MAG: hypothetical protein LUD76_04170 [Alistipes sp.]|nr:hypothetical protein [Alistipes sp.]
MSKNMAFRYDGFYLLSREARGIFYSYDSQGNEVDARFRHFTVNRDIYLEISTVDGNETEVRTLKVIEEASDAISYYKSFFGLHSLASRASMPSQREPVIVFSEDLTEYYRQAYPDKGLTSATALYRMVFNYAAFNTSIPAINRLSS